MQRRPPSTAQSPKQEPSTCNYTHRATLERWSGWGGVGWGGVVWGGEGGRPGVVEEQGGVEVAEWRNRVVERM